MIVISEINIKKEHKKLMLEGLVYKLNQFTNNMPIGFKNTKLKEFINLKLLLLNVKLNQVFKQNTSNQKNIIEDADVLLEKVKNFTESEYYDILVNEVRSIHNLELINN